MRVLAGLADLQAQSQLDLRLHPLQRARCASPQDQAWIETLLGHLKGDWPHLEKIREPGAGLNHAEAKYNEVRLHASIGNVTPDDEHEDRGDATRQQRRDGLDYARHKRITDRRSATPEENQ